MEHRDIALIHELIPDHPQLARLMTEHTDLERKLEQFGKQCFLTQPEVVEQRNLKKRKLAGRDEIERILTRFR